MAFVKLDANKKFQAFRNSEYIKFYVRGCTGSDVTLFTNWNDVASGHVAYTWYTVDVSGYGVPSNSIVILELYNHKSDAYAGLRFRRNGDADCATYGQAGTVGAHQFIMVGVDANSKFQHRKSNNDYGNFYIVGYIENVGTWRASPSSDVSGTTTGVWTNIDITAETSSNAKVALFNVKCGWVSQQPRKADFRKTGSSDDQYVYGEHWYNLPASSIFYIVGLNDNQIFEAKIEASAINIYVLGYITEPAVNYELDLEVQWASADYDEANEELCMYGGTMDAENIRVDVWYNSTWQNVFTDLASGWNNVSISIYLDSPTFTIRFKDGTESDDTTQGSWDIDVVLLHVRSDGYTSEVEFTGPSNTEDWSQLNWTINIGWTIGSINVTLQLYDYALGDYPTSGNGYMAYTSDDTPNTDENRSQAINVNPTHFRNATGHWKMKITGVKATDTQYDLKADWIEFKAVKIGTLFTFENGGPLTSHLVSLWISNSTHHRRYDINIFINSGDTESYIRSDITLPNKPYTVKVVTERGNTAVFTGHQTE